MKQPHAEVVEKVVIVQQPPPCRGGGCRPKTEYIVDEPCRGGGCRPRPEYIVEERPCKGNKCNRPKLEYEEICVSYRCRTCRQDCGGNDRCLKDCYVVERCRLV